MNDQEAVVYVYKGILAIRKNEILPFTTTWMGLEGIMLSKITGRERQMLCFYLYVESKK